jgi:hypothetical protein
MMSVTSGPPGGHFSHRRKTCRRMVSVLTFVGCAGVWFVVGLLVARC